MKRLLPFILVCIVFASRGQAVDNTFTNSEINATNFPIEKCEFIYANWLAAVATGPGDGDGLTSWSPDTQLAQAWREINSNKIAMAYFMCNKLANSHYTNRDAIAPWGRLYEDIHLLTAVAGIHSSLEYLMEATRFSEEWNAGVYKDPSIQVKQLCEAQLSKENVDFIRANDFMQGLLPICHYGIFAAPELIKQIKQHNSRHAFAAYLLVTARIREADDYTHYFQFNDEQFLTAQDKIDHIKKTFAEMKERDGGNSEIMKRISSALDDSIPITAPKPKIFVVDSSTEFLKTITDKKTGQYAVVNSTRDTVSLKEASGKIIWSTNVVQGIENEAGFNWGQIREMNAINDVLLVTEGYGGCITIHVPNGHIRLNGPIDKASPEFKAKFLYGPPPPKDW